MEPILNLITGENPYKYSLTLGLVMIFFAIFYPLDKKNQNKLQIVEQNTKTELLNLQIKNLNEDVKMLTIKTRELALEINKFKKSNSSKYVKLKNQLDELRKKSQLNELFLDSISIKEIEIKGNKERIIELGRQADTFGNYSIALTIFGVILTLVGSYGWIIKPLFQRTQP